MKNIILLIIILFGSKICLAERVLAGAKQSPLKLSQEGDKLLTSTNSAPFLQMMLSLIIVILLLKVFLPKLMEKFNRKFGNNISSSGSILIKEMVSFGPGKLALVEVNDRTLLLSCTPQSVSLVSDLTSSKPQPDFTAFFELLDRAPTKNLTDLKANFSDPLDRSISIENLNTPSIPSSEAQKESKKQSDSRAKAKLALEKLSNLIG